MVTSFKPSIRTYFALFSREAGQAFAREALHILRNARGLVEAGPTGTQVESWNRAD